MKKIPDGIKVQKLVGQSSPERKLTITKMKEKKEYYFKMRRILFCLHPFEKNEIFLTKIYHEQNLLRI